MDREARAATVSVWLRWGFTLSPSAGTGLADLAPRAKVVQTVVCSTFARGAKPATRKVADGERMNPRGRAGAFAPTTGHAAARRGCRPVPRGVWAVAPAVSTPHCLRGTRQDLPCTNAERLSTPRKRSAMI